MRVAVAQYPAVFGDPDLAIDRCAAHVRGAAEAGADVVAFSESWLGGYPAWCFGAASWDDPLGRRLYGDLVSSSVVLDGRADPLGPVRVAARELGIAVVLGLTEREADGSGTIYNAQVTIDATGAIVNHHRKITATSTEKNVWAPGDGAGLRVVATGGVRIGGLICWEHWNPLARQVLHAGHEDVHIAAWPDLSEQHELASRTYAIEGRCFVVVAASILRRDEVPDEMAAAFDAGLADGDESGHHVFDGGSGVIGPDGRWIVGPVREQAGLIVADVDPASLPSHRFTADVAGHYQRSDLFTLTVDATRRPASGVVRHD